MAQRGCSDAALFALEARESIPGMLLKAVQEHDADPCASIMVGDKESDVEAGRRAGLRALRFKPGLRLDDFLAASLKETLPYPLRQDGL